MSVEAVGVYFDRLIALRGLKVKTVSEQAGVKPGYISRLIAQTIKEPGAGTLRSINDAVGGSWEHVGMLLHDDATMSDAKQLADQWFNQIPTSDRDRAIQVLRELVAELEEDPDKIDRYLSSAYQSRRKTP